MNAAEQSVFYEDFFGAYYVNFGYADEYERGQEYTIYGGSGMASNTEGYFYTTYYDYPELSLSASELAPQQNGLRLDFIDGSPREIQVVVAENQAEITFTFDAVKAKVPHVINEERVHTYYDIDKEEWVSENVLITMDIEYLDEMETISQTLILTDFSPEKIGDFAVEGRNFDSWESFIVYAAEYAQVTEFEGTDGNDVIDGANLDDHLNGQAGDDVLRGHRGHDTLDGGSGDDVLEGGEGNDILIGGIGADIMRGGAGNDIYYVDDIGDKIVESANAGVDTVHSSVSYTLATHVENLVLSGSDNIYGAGNNAANTLTGNSGVNRLNAGRGDDTVYGMGGNDTLNGGAGNDKLYGGDGNDIINGGEGDDTLYGDTGDDILNGGSGNDYLYGGEGNDTYWFARDSGHDELVDVHGSNSLRFADDIGIDDVVVYSSFDTWIINIKGALQSSLIIYPFPDSYPDQDNNIQSIPIDTFIFADRSYSLSEFAVLKEIPSYDIDNQTILGTPENDVLTGSTGNDIIDGKAGDDRMSGGAGDDIYYVDSRNDMVIEIADRGNDSVYSSISYTLSANVENLTLTGNADIFGAGNNGDNMLTGNSGNNRLNVGRGDDTLYGMDGNDTLNGGDGNDTLDGGSGTDRLNGGAGNDTYLFNLGNESDIISDYEGNNTVRFGEGIFESNLTFQTASNNQGGTNWVFSLAGSNDVLTILNQYSEAGSHVAVDTFVIDGNEYSADEMLARLSDDLVLSEMLAIEPAIPANSITDTITKTEAFADSAYVLSPSSAAEIYEQAAGAVPYL